MSVGGGLGALTEPARSGLAAALFAPSSVALIGASSDPAKPSSRPLEFLRRAGYGGRVYPVNPRVERLGWYGGLSGLPEVPDHVYVMTPTSTVVDVVAECAELGVPVVTVMTSGFAESGADGIRRQQQLADVLRGSMTRILGPSSLGVVDLHSRLRLTANAAFSDAVIPVGSTFVASHSGSMIGSILSRGAARGLGFSAFVSVGGEVDLSIGEVCQLAVHDRRTHGFVLFLENLRHAGDLRRFAEVAGEAGKPVVVYKLGRSAAAAQLAVSHTGALSGADDVARAFFEDCGWARVDTLDGLVESIGLIGSTAPFTGSSRGVGVLTTTGGGAAMVVDQLGLRGVDVRAPSPDTLARLAGAGIAVEPGAIIDLTLAGTRPEVMNAALEVASTAPEFDLTVVVVGSSARLQPELAVQPIINAKPTGVAVFLVPEAPVALDLLGTAGVPAFRTPESCADAVAAALARRPVRPRPSVVSAPDGPRELLDERDSYAVLADAGVPVPRYATVTVGDPVIDDIGIAFPLVAKALTRRMAHKSDAGCVRLGLADGTALAAAVAEIAQNYARACGEDLERVLVLPMEHGLTEILIGYRRDPAVGPIVLVAPGGTEAELRGERALRLAPVDLAMAHEMFAELPSLGVLRGHRNRPQGDLRALAEVVVAMSRLAERSEIAEAEVNPVLVRPQGQGCVVVDAVVYVSRPSAAPGLNGVQ